GRRESHEIAHRVHADWFATPERFAVIGADRPAPVSCLIANAVDGRWRFCRPAGDELAGITFDGGAFAVPIGTDVDDKTWRLEKAQVNTPIVKNSRRVKGLAGHIGFSELRPEPCRFD